MIELLLTLAVHFNANADNFNSTYSFVYPIAHTPPVEFWTVDKMPDIRDRLLKDWKPMPLREPDWIDNPPGFPLGSRSCKDINGDYSITICCPNEVEQHDGDTWIVRVNK